VPRYAEFHPYQVANIYPREVPRLEIARFECSTRFQAAVSTAGGPARPELCNLAESIEKREIDFGDPPNYGNCRRLVIEAYHLQGMWQISFSAFPGRDELLSCTVESLVSVLNNGGVADRPVIDRVGLLGKYDFHFTATPASFRRSQPELTDVSPFSAMRDLGLGLQAHPCGHRSFLAATDNPCNVFRSKPELRARAFLFDWIENEERSVALVCHDGTPRSSSTAEQERSP
jgi:hypothetical protein